jgi:hypothetical protein
MVVLLQQRLRPLDSLPSTPRGGEAAWWGEVCCGLALPDDRPAPSTRGEGLPSPPLGVGREAAGSMTGGASPLSAGGERELGPHTSSVRSELGSVRSELGVLGAN